MGRRAGRGLCLLLALSTAAAGAAPVQSSFVVIVNEANGVAGVSETLIARMFLKKVTRWDDRTAVMPADLAADSDTRRAFSKGVLDRAVRNVAAYWRRAIYSGRASPPKTFGTDAEVVAFVRAHRGAIGYVSPTASLEGVKVLKLTGPEER